MRTQAAGRKKQIETLYVEEARRASSIFPGGALAPFENPDFMLPAENGILGIEVTELCREKPRTEAATLAKIPAKAETLYNSLEGSAPIDVNVAFSRRATDLAPKQLINSLVDFIYARRNHRGNARRASCLKVTAISGFTNRTNKLIQLVVGMVSVHSRWKSRQNN